MKKLLSMLTIGFLMFANVAGVSAGPTPELTAEPALTAEPELVSEPANNSAETNSAETNSAETTSETNNTMMIVGVSAIAIVVVAVLACKKKAN